MKEDILARYNLKLISFYKHNLIKKNYIILTTGGISILIVFKNSEKKDHRVLAE